MTEISTLKQINIRKLKRGEMKFIRCTAGCGLLGQRINEDY
jgi:hypothetical protein